GASGGTRRGVGPQTIAKRLRLAGAWTSEHARRSLHRNGRSVGKQNPDRKRRRYGRLQKCLGSKSLGRLVVFVVVDGRSKFTVPGLRSGVSAAIAATRDEHAERDGEQLRESPTSTGDS